MTTMDVTTLDAMLSAPAKRDARLDRISTRARKMHFGRAVLSLIAMLLVGLGRLVFGIFAVLWLMVTWCAAAFAEGWNEARAKRAERRGDAAA